MLFAIGDGQGDDDDVDSRRELVVGHNSRTRHALRIIEEPCEKASQICAERLDASDIEIHVIDSPDDCLPDSRRRLGDRPATARRQSQVGSSPTGVMSSAWVVTNPGVIGAAGECGAVPDQALHGEGNRGLRIRRDHPVRWSLVQTSPASWRPGDQRECLLEQVGAAQTG